MRDAMSPRESRSYRPLRQGPSPTTHGIHNPPKLEAVFGDELDSRLEMYTANLL